jgi:hypothetical protein
LLLVFQIGQVFAQAGQSESSYLYFHISWGHKPTTRSGLILTQGLHDCLPGLAWNCDPPVYDSGVAGISGMNHLAKVDFKNTKNQKPET